MKYRGGEGNCQPLDMGNVEFQFFAYCRAYICRLIRVPIRATMWYIEAERRSFADTYPQVRCPVWGQVFQVDHPTLHINKRIFTGGHYERTSEDPGHAKSPRPCLSD